MTNKEKAIHQLSRHADQNEAHVTADGQVFFKKHQAESHAGRTKAGKKIESFKRSEVLPKNGTKKSVDHSATDTKIDTKAATGETVKDVKDIDVKAEDVKADAKQDDAKGDAKQDDAKGDAKKDDAKSDAPKADAKK